MTAMSTPETPKPSKKQLRHKKLYIILAAVLSFVLVFVSAFFIIVKLGENRLRKDLIQAENVEVTDEFDENAVYHNGETYYYNKNLVNILFIGVDYEAKSATDKSQADALYLASIDTVTNKVNIVSVSRNTVTEFDILDSNGEVYGTENKQICLSYAYGNTPKQSSENCAKAVSGLLYNVPLNGYYSIHMKSIEQLVDSVGGVTVTLPSNITDSYFSGRQGQTISLKGSEVSKYLRMRGDSNAPRVERHKAFISGFITSAKMAVKQNPMLPTKMANRLSKDAVTNLDIASAVYLATKALNWNVTFSSPPGSYGEEDGLEVFRIHETKMRDFIVQNFYIKS